MAKLGIDRGFLWEFGKLDRSVQDKVYEVFGKFEHATHAGLHLEKINNVRDRRLRSIRIDQFWRGVVLAPDSGDSYTLLKVLPHDDAYDWARRRRVSVNRATGGIEIRDVSAIEDSLPRLAAQASTTEARLFGDVGDADLRRLGIDDQVLAIARTLSSEEQLDALRSVIPEPQYDVLLGLATGMSPEQVWSELAGVIATPAEYDPEDVTAAVERSPRRVILVSGPDELMEVFSYPFALWRIYLHPSQHRMAYGSFRGPARVTGGPGTGKTVAALHRAKHLAAHVDAEKSVLLTTFTKTLVRSLEDNLRLLIDDDAMLRRIDVRHLDQVAYQVVSKVHGRLAVLQDAKERERWSDLAARLGRLGVQVTPTFLAQEWRHVMLAQGLTAKAAYLQASRAGRGKPLRQNQRESIWWAMETFMAGLSADGVWTYETICVEAARLLGESERKPYRHIIVDEGQDLSPWAWRVLRAAVAPGPDDLFIAADTHQRIYDHRVSLKQVGIEVTGRSERLKLNYRTTAEILGWSFGLLHGERIDDMSEGLETLAGCRSEVHGKRPRLESFPSKSEELANLVTTVRAWLDGGIEPGHIGVTARSNALVDDAVQALARAGVPAVSLAKRQPRETEVPVATMHRMKGLEFGCVAIVAATEHHLPPPSSVTPESEDALTHRLDLQRERCLLFVACTRAREELSLTWHGSPSPLLPNPYRTDR